MFGDKGGMKGGGERRERMGEGGRGRNGMKREEERGLGDGGSAHT